MPGICRRHIGCGGLQHDGQSNGGIGTRDARGCVIGRGLALLLAASTGLGALAQTTGRQNPSLVINSMTGRDLFAFYCATCHGRDATGNGPMAASLKVPPPNLTLLARRSGGLFPRARVDALVANDAAVPMAAHGSTDMPAWGPVFRGLDPSDSFAKIRIANVVEYVRSIQVK